MRKYTVALLGKSSLVLVFRNANHVEASVTLFPINWREPFGLVMIESMATGTPVVAMGLGSVPEVIAHDKTGYVCHSLEAMIEMVSYAMNLDRHTCREYVVNRFSVESMASEYERVIN